MEFNQQKCSEQTMFDLIFLFVKVRIIRRIWGYRILKLTHIRMYQMHVHNTCMSLLIPLPGIKYSCKPWFGIGWMHRNVPDLEGTEPLRMFQSAIFSLVSRIQQCYNDLWHYFTAQDMQNTPKNRSTLQLDFLHYSPVANISKRS